MRAHNPMGPCSYMYPDHPKYSVDEYLVGSTVLYAHLKPSLIYYWSCIVLYRYVFKVERFWRTSIDVSATVLAWLRVGNAWV